MVYPPNETIYQELRSKYKGLVIDYEKDRIYNTVFAVCVLTAFTTAMMSFALLNPQNQVVTYYIAVFGTFAVSSIVGRYFKKKIKNLTGNQVTVVKTFYACKALDDFLESTLH